MGGRITQPTSSTERATPLPRAPRPASPVQPLVPDCDSWLVPDCDSWEAVEGAQVCAMGAGELPTRNLTITRPPGRPILAQIFAGGASTPSNRRCADRTLIADRPAAPVATPATD